MPRHSRFAQSVRRQLARVPLPVPLDRLAAACVILLLAAINILLPVQAQTPEPGTGKLLFEMPAIALDAKAVGAVMRRVNRMDKPPAPNPAANAASKASEAVNKLRSLLGR